MRSLDRLKLAAVWLLSTLCFASCKLGVSTTQREQPKVGHAQQTPTKRPPAWDGRSDRSSSNWLVNPGASE